MITIPKPLWLPGLSFYFLVLLLLDCVWFSIIQDIATYVSISVCNWTCWGSVLNWKCLEKAKCLQEILNKSSSTQRSPLGYYWVMFLVRGQVLPLLFFFFSLFQSLLHLLSFFIQPFHLDLLILISSKSSALSQAEPPKPPLSPWDPACPSLLTAHLNSFGLPPPWCVSLPTRALMHRHTRAHPGSDCEPDGA